MKHVLTYARRFACVALLVAASSPASMAEEKTRFESSGFIQSLDLFIAEQMAKLRGKNKDEKGEAISDLELSLRNETESPENEFFYLRDVSPVATNGATKGMALDNRPNFSSLLAPDGTVRGSYGQDLFEGTSRIGVMSFGGDKNNAANRGFEIAVQSAYRMSLQGLQASTGFGNSDLAERRFNVGLSLGYSGFNLDASVMRQTSVFEPEMTGFDVGFSYEANSWSARLSLSEYQEGADLFGIENEARNIISVELGASYRLSERIGLLGGIRYHDYGSRLLVNPEQGEKSQMIFLGGRLKF